MTDKEQDGRMAEKESFEMEEQFCGLVFVWVLKNKNIALSAYDAQ